MLLLMVSKGCGHAAVPSAPPRGAPMATAQLGGAGPPKIAKCGSTAVKSARCQRKEAKEGILAVIIFLNRIVIQCPVQLSSGKTPRYFPQVKGINPRPEGINSVFSYCTIPPVGLYKKYGEITSP